MKVVDLFRVERQRDALVDVVVISMYEAQRKKIDSLGIEGDCDAF